MAAIRVLPQVLPELESKLQASATGLSSAEAQKRIQQYGYNELPEKKVIPLLKFLSYFWGPIPWMIEIAAVLSLLVRHWADFWIITTLLVFNGLLGFWEEYQAGNAIAALKAQLALEAKAKRDNEWKTIPARELVPGDLIRLRMGDIVPADAACFGDDPIEVDQIHPYTPGKGEVAIFNRSHSKTFWWCACVS